MEHKKNYLVYLAVEDILPHPKNPRKELGDLSEMAESVKANGIMQNLTVVEVGELPSDRLAELGITAEDIDQGRYMVVIGHRRLAAAKLAGLSEVPCVISDMSYEDQLATMLTENVQRVDLNPYEQAQGFRQLSMELGMSVSDISERTGFSETTVRRRLKLGNLDGDVLRRVTTRAAEKGRQLSMADLEAVAEIEDETTRKSVLVDIGTDNFNMRLKSALKEQKEEQARNEWRRLLKARGLVEIPQNKVWDYDTWKTCVQQQDAPVNKPTDEAADALVGSWLETGGQYGFAFYYGWLYIKRNISQEKQEPPPATANGMADTEDGAEIAKAMEEPSEPEQKGPTEGDLRRVACDRLKAAFETAYECRRVFIDGMSEEVARRVLPAMVGLYVKLCEIDANIPELTEEEAAAIRRRLEKKPHAAAVYLLYAQMGDSKHSSCYHGYYPAYIAGTYDEDACDNEPMKLIYDAFVSVGYGMSDMEKELLDGTSPLYYHEGYTIEDSDEKGQEEDVGESEEVKTRFEAYQAMTEEELTAEIGDIDNYYGELVEAIHFQETSEDVARAVSYFCCPYEAAVDEDDDAEKIRRAKCAEHSENCERCITAWLNEPHTKKDV